ncbi:MAG: metallophosphoesterase, partial [Epsilonproteobacteria bacterium]|nr:metallophosphoesterase [Campylobacterota bacterium]
IGDEGSKINLVGVYDIFGYRVLHHMPEFEDALKGIDDAHPTILLAHQPKYIEEVTHSVDLMLSGHTHGAQLYPFRFLVKLQQPYVSGLHRHNEKLQIYVSRGSGFWGPPMRLGSMSEITHITLLPC